MRYDKRCPACGERAREEVIADGQGGVDHVRYCKTAGCINYDPKLRDKTKPVYQSISVEKDAYHDLQAMKAALAVYGEKLTLSQAIRKAKALLICPHCGRACGHAFTKVCKEKVEAEKDRREFEKFLENPGRDHEGQPG